MPFALHGGAALNSFKKLITAGADAEPGGAEMAAASPSLDRRRWPDPFWPRLLTRSASILVIMNTPESVSDEDEYRRKRA